MTTTANSTSSTRPYVPPTSAPAQRKRSHSVPNVKAPPAASDSASLTPKRVKPAPKSASSANNPATALVLRATPSTSVPMAEETLAEGQLLGIDPDANIYVYEATIQWRRKPYKLTLRFAYDSKDDLKEIIKKHQDAFLLHLAKKIPPDHAIKPGVSFNFIFTEDGYTVFIPNDQCPFDLKTNSIQEMIQSGYITNHLSIEDEAAKTFSKAFHCTDPEKMEEVLQDEALAPYRSSPKNATPKPTPNPAPTTSPRPVGFINSGTLCWLASAIQTWAFPTFIRQELLKPGVIQDVDGNPHPLKVVLQKYENAQTEKAPKPISLENLVKYLEGKGIRRDIQDDAHAALSLLQHDLNLRSTCPLAILVKSSWSYKHPETDEECWFDLPNQPEGNYQMWVRSVHPTRGKSLEDLVKEPHVEDFADQTQEKSIPDPNDPSKWIAVKQLQHKQIYPSNPNFLMVHVHRARPDQGRIVKDTTPIDIPLTLTLDGHEHELMCICEHFGTTAQSGHYKTYVRDGNGFIEINDKKCRSLSSEETATMLQEAATDGYLFAYIKKGLTANPAPSPSSANTVVTPKAPISSTDVDFGVECGKLTEAGPDFVLVNPTNKTLTANLSTFDDAVKAEIAHIKQKKRNSYYFHKPKEVTYSEGDVVPTNGHGQRILHTVLPDSDPLTQKQVQKFVNNSLAKAKESGMTRVAFALISCKNPSEVFQWMQDAINIFAQKNGGFKELKIILTPEQKERLLPPASAKPEPMSFLLSKSKQLSVEKQPVEPSTKKKKPLKIKFDPKASEITVDLRLYDIDPQDAIALFLNKLEIFARTDQKATIRLIVPDKTPSFDEPLKELHDRIHVEMMPQKFEGIDPLLTNGKIVFHKGYFTVETAPSPQLTQESADPLNIEAASLLLSEKNQSYVENRSEFVLDFHKKNEKALFPEINSDECGIFQYKIEDSEKALEEFVQKLESGGFTNPHNKKIRIILPEEFLYKGRLCRMDRAIRTLLPKDPKTPPPLTPPKSSPPSLWQKFWSGGGTAGT